jgi:membrane protease YdiL (CAAX protease family)
MHSFRRDTYRLLLLGSTWLGLGLLGVRTLAFHLPRSVAAALTEASYFASVWIVITVLGVVASFRLLDEPRERLGFTRPKARPVALALLVVPAVLVVSLYLGWKLALPTIREELLARGGQAVRATVSSSNRAAQKAPLGTVAFYAVVVTPLAEEFLFRGALWSAAEGILRRRVLATLVTAALFAWLHIEGNGGVALLGFVQTLLLGVALGTARHFGESVAVPVALHAGFNALTLAQKNGLFGKALWPLPLPIPLRLWFFAVAAGVVAIAVWLTGRPAPAPWELVAPESEPSPRAATPSDPQP